MLNFYIFTCIAKKKRLDNIIYNYILSKVPSLAHKIYTEKFIMDIHILYDNHALTHEDLKKEIENWMYSELPVTDGWYDHSWHSRLFLNYKYKKEEEVVIVSCVFQYDHKLRHFSNYVKADRCDVAKTLTITKIAEIYPGVAAASIKHIVANLSDLIFSKLLQATTKK